MPNLPTNWGTLYELSKLDDSNPNGAGRGAADVRQLAKRAAFALAGPDPLDLAAAVRLARLNRQRLKWLLAHARTLDRQDKLTARNKALLAICRELMPGLKPSVAAREILRTVRERRQGALLSRLAEVLGEEFDDLPAHRQLRRILGGDMWPSNSSPDGQI